MNRIYMILLLAAALSLLPGKTAAQQTDNKPNATGIVTDTSGNPLFQAVISDTSGRAVGTSGLTGKFSIETESAELTFSMVGFSDVTAAAGRDMAVVLNDDPARMDEILDFGFNVMRRRLTVSEAVSTVRGSALEDIPTANFSQLLAGQLAGLGTMETSSDPGNAEVGKYVRGISTINGTSPLIVIDGIIMQDYNVEYLTAAEIENIVLLKDAAATAIYGLKGANGVLVINTKSGLPGTFDVRVTADFSMQQINRKPLKLSSLQYASLRNEGWANDGAMGDAPFSEYQIGQIRAGDNPLYPDNDYYKMFVRDFATMERVGVTLSGGNRRTRVWSNVNMMNQTPLFRQETDRYVATPRRLWINFRTKVDIDISKTVHAFASVAGNIRNDRLAGNDKSNNDIYSSIFSLPPTMIGPTAPDGTVTTMETVSTPTYGILNRSGYTKYTGMYVSTAAGLKVDLDSVTKGLSVTGKVAYQSSNDRYNNYSQNFRRVYYDYATGRYVQLGSGVDTSLQPSAKGTFQYALSYIAQVDYDRSFGRHTISGRLYTYFTEEQFNTVNSSYPALGFPYYNHNSGLNLSYNYADRYVLSGTLSLPASDALPRKNRYVLLPSVSAAWIISNETFLKGSRWLTLLKARASYGISGTDDFAAGNFRYLYRDYIPASGEVRLLGNPDLEAEKHKIQNYAVEIGLWNRLYVSFDYFSRRTDNMLIDSGRRIPEYQGIYVSNYMKVNQGSMRNDGFELALDYTMPLGSGWTVSAGGNWTHSVNKVLYTGEQPYPGAASGYSGYAYSYRTDGYAAGQLFGYLIDDAAGRYISTAAELAEYTAKYGEIGVPRLGDFKYRDLNGDGVVNSKDMAPIGKGTIPTDFVSIRAGFGWKGIDVSLTMQGVAGYCDRVDYDTELNENGIYNDLHLSAWTPERAASGAEILAPALSYNSSPVSQQANDYLIADRSFWRLKNASLSYTVPARITRGSGISRLKIVLSGHNLFTVSALASKVIDPETGNMTALPPMRVVNLGVKIEF